MLILPLAPPPQAILCTFAGWLHKEKQIYETMNNLEHDNAKHALDFHRVSTCGIICYLILDVKKPRPSLFLRDHWTYLSCVRHAGGIVIIMYVIYAGSPVMRFQRAIRCNKGKIIQLMHAYSFHVNRSLSHKTKSVYISLVTLTGMVCAHPKLQEVLHMCGCVSLLGTIFAAFDRMVEYLNLLQQKRATAFKGYESQLHFTEYLRALVHVDAAWKEADGSGSGIDSGFPAYLYNDVSQIRRKLVETLGTDLTVVERGNPLWHTGNAVPLEGGIDRERMPWNYIWQVAYAKACGFGLDSLVAWNTFVNDFIDGHLFPM